MTDTINIPRAELRGALRQLSFIRSYFHLNDYASAILEEQIEAFRARLSVAASDISPECVAGNEKLRHVPAAWMCNECGGCDSLCAHGRKDTPLYAEPPQREWQGLTDDERKEIFESMPGGMIGFLRTWGWLPFTKAIEAKLKEKNQ